MMRLLVVALLIGIGLLNGPSFAMSAKEKELGSLYEELLAIKSKADFTRLGFDRTGPYHSWLLRVERLRDSSSLGDFPAGVLPGDLLVLGTEYATSRGAETDYTRQSKPMFQAALSPPKAIAGQNGKLLESSRFCPDLASYQTFQRLLREKRFAESGALIDACPKLFKGATVKGPLSKKTVRFDDPQSPWEEVYLQVETSGSGKVWVPERQVDFQ